jgi:hypothetical protein
MVQIERVLQIVLPAHQSAFLWGPRKTGKSTYLRSCAAEKAKQGRKGLQGRQGQPMTEPVTFPRSMHAQVLPEVAQQVPADRPALGGFQELGPDGAELVVDDRGEG